MTCLQQQRILRPFLMTASSRIRPYVNPEEGVRDQINILKISLSLFETINDFTCYEYEQVCHLIALTAQSTGAVRGV